MSSRQITPPRLVRVPTQRSALARTRWGALALFGFLAWIAVEMFLQLLLVLAR